MRSSPPASDQFLLSEGASEMYVDEVVDGQGRLQYIDRVGSVSALPDGRTTLWLPEHLLDEQHRRFLNGS